MDNSETYVTGNQRVNRIWHHLTDEVGANPVTTSAGGSLLGATRDIGTLRDSFGTNQR